MQTLWNNQISYSDGKYSGYSATIPAGTSEFDKKLTIAGVVKAKNTCLAMYAAENGYSQYYDVLANYSADGSIVPVDLTYAAANSTEQARLASALGLDIVNNTDDQKTFGELGTLLSNYYSATGNANQNVYANDAAAYYTMMNVVNTMNQNDTLSEDDLDAYFNSVSGPASMFQQLVGGTVTLSALKNSLGGMTSAENAVTITAMSNGSNFSVVVGPTTVLD